MNRFHTPSFGDEVFDFTDVEDHSKRIRNLDLSTADYYPANDESLNSTTVNAEPSPSVLVATTTSAVRKQLGFSTPVVSLVEPAKPISAYGLFFRDTVSTIKQQNPDCSFPELSRIAQSMWDALDESHKDVYNQKHVISVQEYIKHLHNYRQLIGDRQEQCQPSDINHSIDGHNQQHQDQYTSNSIISTLATSNTLVNSTQLAMFGQTEHQQQQVPLNGTINALSRCAVPEQTQLLQQLTEAAGTQMCTRENCNKPAIINPDWEDEYCSNECVVIHCRNVFNEWVRDSRKQ